MSKVSDMVKMYSQPQLKPTGAGASGGVRKWPPVSTPAVPSTTNKPPPPVTPKPNGIAGRPNGPSTLGRPATAAKPFQSNENTQPPWQRNRAAGQNDIPKQENIPLWKQKALEREAEKNKEEQKEQENIPQWKRDLNRAKEPAWKNQTHEESITPKPTPPWQKPTPDTTSRNASSNIHKGPPPPKPASSAKPTWSERNKNANKFSNGVRNGDDHPDFPPPPDDSSPRNSFLGTHAPARTNQQNKSFSYNTVPKPNIEKSSGSFGASSPKPVRKQSESSASGSPKHRVSSFLHTKNSPQLPTPFGHTADHPPPRTPTPPSSYDKPKTASGPPRKLQLPRDIFSKPPPRKTPKPANVVLPSNGKKKSTPLPPPPSMTSRPLPPPVSRDHAFPSPAGFPTGFPAPNLPPSLPSRPLDFPAPVTPSKLPLPLPPTTIEDDIYDNPGDESLPPPPITALPLPELPMASGPRPPPIRSGPPPLLKRQSSGLIPTWDDEADAIYDETPDEPPPSRGPMGFPTPGNVSQIPEDTGEELYDVVDVEENMRLKKMQQEQRPRSTNGSMTSNDSKEKKEKDKKKKEAEKRKKEIKKKFNIEDDNIVPEGHGVVKENCKGSGKNLAVSAGENIDVIRMTNNPKGKWLIRNSQGDFGYVDSDKVTVNVDQLRTTFGVGNRAPSGIGGGPPVPPIIPIMADEDDDVIYDTTADEDLYEEL